MGAYKKLGYPNLKFEVDIAGDVTVSVKFETLTDALAYINAQYDD